MVVREWEGEGVVTGGVREGEREAEVSDLGVGRGV